MPSTTLRLRKDLSRHLRAGHPWVWRDALPPVRLASGTLVDLLGVDGKWLARGLWDAQTPIAMRVYCLNSDQALDEELFRQRMLAALSARRGALDLTRTSGFRLVNGEGDYLPGLVIDVYGDTAVLRLDGELLRTWTDVLAGVAMDLLRPLGVERLYEKSRGRGRVLVGSAPPHRVEYTEHGVRFAADVVHGQKTGAFLDQRENRRLVWNYARGLRVANLFSYTGGFSLLAALGGATRVDSVDSAAGALDDARNNFVLNGLEPDQHGFHCADVFDWLSGQQKSRQVYDLVIVDPPSFAPSEKALSKALPAYRDLFVAAVNVVERGGLLCPSSCSSHVDMEDFLGVLRDVQSRSGRSIRLLEIHGQPADHPTTPAFKEGRYLKFIVARID